jgi:hypothetical protein
MNKMCQSCGMPMRRDPGNGGTNNDGSKNAEYCSLCYQSGEFTQANVSASEMQTFCIDKLKEKGVPKPIGWLLTRNIPKLGRWKG